MRFHAQGNKCKQKPRSRFHALKNINQFLRFWNGTIKKSFFWRLRLRKKKTGRSGASWSMRVKHSDYADTLSKWVRLELFFSEYSIYCSLDSIEIVGILFASPKMQNKSETSFTLWHFLLQVSQQLETEYHRRPEGRRRSIRVSNLLVSTQGALHHAQGR